MYIVVALVAPLAQFFETSNFTTRICPCEKHTNKLYYWKKYDSLRRWVDEDAAKYNFKKLPGTWYSERLRNKY